VNEVRTVYSLEYIDIPEVFVILHHIGNCCVNVI
jgi:hypothetical protein